jgi:Na+-translocating ferredoxin:NAD+ oxidoreductase RnfC subunit
MRKFLPVLKNGGEASMPSSDLVVIDITTEPGKMVAAAKERNTLAMANLTMAFETENLFGIIYKTMRTDWPAGLAHEVVAQLFNKYSPDDRISIVELRSMLNGVSMKDAEDPSTLVEQVSSIQN